MVNISSTFFSVFSPLFSRGEILLSFRKYSCSISPIFVELNHFCDRVYFLFPSTSYFLWLLFHHMRNICCLRLVLYEDKSFVHLFVMLTYRCSFADHQVLTVDASETEVCCYFCCCCFTSLFLFSCSYFCFLFQVLQNIQQ